MPIYFLNLRSRDPAERREVRCECRDLSAALDRALQTARNIIGRGYEPMTMDSRDRVDIEDEHHRPVARIVLAELAQQISPRLHSE